MSNYYLPPNAQAEQLATNADAGVSSTPPKPRLWTVWVTLLAATVVYLVGSVVGVVALAIMYASEHGTQGLNGIEWLAEAGATPSGLLLSILPGHLALLAVTIGAAIASPVPWYERLALKKIQLSWVTVIAAVLATPFWALLWTIPLSPWLENSEHLDIMEEMFSANAVGAGLVVLWLTIAVMPSFSEEFLFRGYIQSRLLQRINVPASIAISSVLFCVFHMDPTHIVAVVPLGIWLGIMGWLAGSIIPAMLAHCYNNSISIAGIAFDNTDSVDVSLSMTNLFVLSVGAPAALIAVRGLWLGTKPTPVEDQTREGEPVLSVDATTFTGEPSR